MFMKHLTVLLIAAVCAACGGGSEVASGGGSGIGGTGISFVKGNVVSVNGQTNAGQAKALFASTGIYAGVTVSGGGKTSTLNQFGGFELADVTPSENLVLVFNVEGSGNANLPVGLVGPGQTARVNDIKINTNSGDATASSITRSRTEPDDDDSEDFDSEDDDDDSEDNESEEDEEENEEEGEEEDEEEGEEDDDDSEDQS
jgi:hypothetical protein